jgi:hypothetical protein
MSEDIIEWKPRVGPFAINLRALTRKLGARLRADKAGKNITKVAERFLKLFEDHGVQLTQIPHFIPQVTLDALLSPERLLPILTSSVLDQAAELFGVRRDWLDGVSDVMYQCRSCYKAPMCFFEDIKELHIDDPWQCVRALCSVKELHKGKGRGQDMVLVLAKRIKQYDDVDVYRYTIYGDEWDWGYLKCRIQLKAMARLFYKTMDGSIPIYKLSRSELEKIRKGLLVPNMLQAAPLISYPSLEDYGLAPDESANAREYYELPLVLKYIETQKLIET